MKEWLKSYRIDAKRADSALNELEKDFKMPYMNPPACDDATRRFLRDYTDKAKLGDPSGFEENIKLNCLEQKHLYRVPQSKIQRVVLLVKASL